MSTTLANPVSRPWRRYLRFSVRGLIVLVLVIGGWLGWIVRSARIQRDAVAAIQNAGGVVMYDWEWKNEEGFPGSNLRHRGSWISSDVDYFGHTTGVAARPSGNRREVGYGRALYANSGAKPQSTLLLVIPIWDTTEGADRAFYL